MNANTHTNPMRQEDQQMTPPAPMAIAPQTVSPHPQTTPLQRWSRILAGAAVTVTLLVSAPSAQAQNAEMLQCMERCVDRYAEPIKEGAFKLVERRDSTPPRGPGDLVNRCPDDTTLTPVDMPVYDEEGLFVVGHKIVWFCLPDDLQPEG